MRAVLIVNGRKSGQFWVRAFALEDKVERARAEVVSERTKNDEQCVMPVLIKYDQDEEYCWFTAFALFIDSVGVIDAHGAVFFTDAANHEMVREDARKAGEAILSGLRTHAVEIRETVPFVGGEK